MILILTRRGRMIDYRKSVPVFSCGIYLDLQHLQCPPHTHTHISSDLRLLKRGASAKLFISLQLMRENMQPVGENTDVTDSLNYQPPQKLS